MRKQAHEKMRSASLPPPLSPPFPALPPPGKIGGGAAVARFFGMTARESLAVGVLMNTRGLVELIILNIGLDAGVLTEVSGHWGDGRGS